MGRKSGYSHAHAHDEDATPAPDAPLIPWKFTKVMNARDLARDDDFLSHIFIEKLGSTGIGQQLLVHRMDPRRRLPKTDTASILGIVQRLISTRPFGQAAIKQAVNEFLELDGVMYFIRDFCSTEINAFATHASRYLELYMPSGCIEIAQTSRYSRITGKNELCILTTRALPVNFLITELKGSLAELTDEEDRDLKKSDSRGGSDSGGMRRDFSVIHSKQLKKNHLFLGPARFVNHDCENNVELFRDGRYITFRTIKPIAMGQELTAHYGNGYFGKKNRHCLCESCEKRGRGGYAPQTEDDGSGKADCGDCSDSDSDVSAPDVEDSEEVNVNERRTRRGVYRTVQDEKSDDDDDDDDEVEGALAVDAEDTPISTTTVTQSIVVKSIITTRRQKLQKSASTSTSEPSREPSVSSTCAVRQSARVSNMRRTEFGLEAKSRGRTRNAPHTEASGSKKDEKSRGATEKDTPAVKVRPPGPNCMTCWGDLAPEDVKEILAKTKTRGKGKAKVIEKDCLRCARHLLIYNAPWPQRVSTSVSYDSSTRESTPVDALSAKLTRSSLSAVDRKLKAARFAQLMIERDRVKEKELERQRLEEEKREKEEAEKKKAERTKRKREEGLEKARAAKRQKQINAESAAPAIDKLSEVGVASERSLRSGRIKATGVVLVSRRKSQKEAEVKVEDTEEVSLPLIRSASEISTHKQPSPVARTPEVVQAVPRRKRSHSPGMPPLDENGNSKRGPLCVPLPHLAGLGIRRTGMLCLRPNPTQVSRFRESPARSKASSSSVALSSASTSSSGKVRASGTGTGTGSSTPHLIEDDTDETGTTDENPATPEFLAAAIAKPVVIHAAGEERIRVSPGARGSLLYDPIRDTGMTDVPSVTDDEEEIEVTSRRHAKMSVPALNGLGLIAKPSPGLLSQRVWSPQALVADMNNDVEVHLVHTQTAPAAKRSQQAQKAISSKSSAKLQSGPTTPKQVRRKLHRDSLETSPETGPAQSRTSIDIQAEVQMYDYRASVKRGRFDSIEIEIFSDEEDGNMILSSDLPSASFRLRAVQPSPRAAKPLSAILQPSPAITSFTVKPSPHSSANQISLPSNQSRSQFRPSRYQTFDPNRTPTQTSPTSASVLRSPLLVSPGVNTLTTSPSLAKILNPPSLPSPGPGHGSTPITTPTLANAIPSSTISKLLDGPMGGVGPLRSSIFPASPATPGSVPFLRKAGWDSDVD